MVDPISVATGLIGLFKTCGGLISAILTEVKSHDLIKDLRHDLEELEHAVRCVGQACSEAKELEVIEPGILAWVANLLGKCSSSLQELKTILEEACGTKNA